MHILNGLGAGYLDLASFITACTMEFDDAYALLLTHESQFEQYISSMVKCAYHVCFNIFIKKKSFNV